MTAGPSRRAWALGTGLPAQNFAQGRIKYVDLDLTRMEGKFAPDIAIPRTPFQGILGAGRSIGSSRRRARGLRAPVLLIKTPTICAAAREVFDTNSMYIAA